jgi:sporulation protein YlmC with PRC-barrel domain
MNELIVREYLGKGIEFKIINGKVYANATSMCKAFGKLFADWRRLKQTEEMVNEVSEAMGIPIGDLVIVENGIGSMVHEELVLELANWINVKFRRWCQTQITILLREGSVSLKPKSEEDMLLELFPTANANLIALTAHNIREVKSLTKEVIHKEEVIVGLVDDIDLATKRQRITQIVRHRSKNYAERYNLLYVEFEKKYHIDIKRRMETYNETHKPKCKNKMEYIDVVMNKIPELYEICCKLFENDIESLKQEWDSTIKRESM